jgi:hypothetical protein
LNPRVALIPIAQLGRAGRCPIVPPGSENLSEVFSGLTFSNCSLSITNKRDLKRCLICYCKFSICWLIKQRLWAPSDRTSAKAIHTPLEATVISKVQVVPSPLTNGRYATGKVNAGNHGILLDIKTNNILNEIDRRVLVSSEATATLIETQAHLGVKTFDAPLPKIAIPIPDRHRVSRKQRKGQEFRLVVRISALVSAFGFGWLLGSSLYSYFDRRDELTNSAAVNAVVERIIAVESDGAPNAKNSRSSATGLGQFVNETWLDLIREYRPDLTKGRSESETLELRRETKLAREITTRLVERNATMLRQRGLPISAAAVYLAHFAGAAGAVAILSASDSADAALVLAGADATGRTKREQLIKANPFLAHFTVADLKIWADRKMHGLDLHAAEVRAAKARQ